MSRQKKAPAWEPFKEDIRREYEHRQLQGPDGLINWMKDKHGFEAT
jgi:hypothetical protein